MKSENSKAFDLLTLKAAASKRLRWNAMLLVGMKLFIMLLTSYVYTLFVILPLFALIAINMLMNLYNERKNFSKVLLWFMYLASVAIVAIEIYRYFELLIDKGPL